MSGHPGIVLRPFGPRHFQRLIEWSPTPEFLLQWSGPAFTYPLTVTQLEAYLAVAVDRPESRRIYAVEEADTGAQVGHVELDAIDRRHRSARLSRVLLGEPAARGQGLGLRMVNEILEIGFGELGLHRIDLFVFDFNAAAIGCYERAGFRKEGLLREIRRIGDAYWSPWIMSILEDEWRRRACGE